MAAIRELATRLRTEYLLRRSDCLTCEHFKPDSELKCEIRPAAACTEKSINCPNYSPVKPTRSSTQPK